MVVVATSEADVVLPPPTALNPIPSLPAALRLDNYEQLLSLLETNPKQQQQSQIQQSDTPTTQNPFDPPSNAATASNASLPFRQWLVFGTESLRTLLMRQVLSDPHTRQFKPTAQSSKSPGGGNNNSASGGGNSGSNANSVKNKNWDAFNSFPYPKSLQRNIVGSQVLVNPISKTFNSSDYNYNYNEFGGGVEASSSAGSSMPTSTIRTTLDGAAEILFQGAGTSTAAAAAGEFDIFGEAGEQPEFNRQQVDVITYFLRPWDVAETQAVIQKIRAWRQPKNQSGGNSGTGGAGAGAGGGSGNMGPSFPTSFGGKSQSQHNQNVHHRIVYVPQITAVVAQVLKDAGLWSAATSITPSGFPSTSAKGAAGVGSNNSANTSSSSLSSMPNSMGSTSNPFATPLSSSSMLNISIQTLQLDLFPIETDVLSLEFEGAMLEEWVEQTPSNLIGACARSLLKLQDVTGKIPRWQSLGPSAEAVLTKLWDITVDEHLAQDSYHNHHNSDRDGHDEFGDEEKKDPSDANTTSKRLPPNHLACLVLDRQMDMVTPMMTPLTYEGLLDEVVGIECGFITVDVSTINPEDDDEVDADDNRKGKKEAAANRNPFGNPTAVAAPALNNLVTLGVHAGDSLYAEVRDQHVEKFGSFLQNQAKALRESHANFTSKGTKKDLQEIHQFVKQIPMFTQNLRSLTNHIHLAELIKANTERMTFREQWQTERSMIEGETCFDVLEEWIASGYHSPYKVLRLLCLQSLCAGGLKSSRYDSFRTQLVQMYGYDFIIPLLHHLELCGWIKRKETIWNMDSTSQSFAALRRLLILINAEVDTVEPDDISYVSSGYAPLSVRLVQTAIQGWTTSTTKQEILKELFVVSSNRIPQSHYHHHHSSSAASAHAAAASATGVAGVETSGVGGVGGRGVGGDSYGIAGSSVGAGAGGGSSSANSVLGGGGGGGRLLDIYQCFPPQDLLTTLNHQPIITNDSLGQYAQRYQTQQQGQSQNPGVVAAATTSSKQKPTLLVIFVGGVTFMEIASLRFLSKRSTFPYHIIIVTTKVWNGTDMFRSLLPK